MAITEEKMPKKLEFHSFDNTGCSLLMSYFVKAPQGKADWDEALQFLNLLYSVAFARAVYVADFEKVEDYAVVKRWFEDFQDDWTSDWGGDQFFRELPVVDRIEEMVSTAADEMLSEVREYTRQLSISGNASSAFPRSSLGDEDYKKTILGPPGALGRDKAVHKIIFKGKRPKAAAKYIGKREGIVPLMFRIRPALLEEIRRLASYGWSKDRSYYIAIRSRMIVNSAYCRCVDGGVTAHVPASSRARNVSDTSERFTQILGRFVWNNLDQEIRQVVRSDLCLSKMIVGETQAALGWMNQYVIPIQIALSVTKSAGRATMTKRIRMMLDEAKNFASQYSTIVDDGNRYDYLTLKPDRTKKETRELGRINAAYPPSESAPSPFRLVADVEIAPFTTGGFPMSNAPYRVKMEVYNCLSEDLHSIFPEFLSRR